MLLGMPEIFELDISLDFVIRNPHCSIAEAILDIPDEDLVPDEVEFEVKVLAILVPLFWFI